MKTLLWPISLVYGQAVKLRNRRFDQNPTTKVSVSVPVISVGNITMGGAGKTPVIEKLVSWAKSKNLKVGVVSRGYKGAFVGVEKVTGENPDRSGDEPAMLAKRHPDIPIYVCPDRVAAAHKLIQKEHVQLIFADDAFQHRRLERNLDVVILDATENLENYALLPVGRGREPLSSLWRADFVIINKSNFADENQLAAIQRRVKEHVPQENIVLSSYRPGAVMNLGSQQSLSLNGVKTGLVSAIAQPGSVQRLVEEQGAEVVFHKQFADHHGFTKTDVSSILELSRRHSVDHIICTEKDAVKLEHFSELADKLWFIRLEVEWATNPERLYEAILATLS